MMQLYSYWRSTAAYRARIALNVKEIEHEIVTVDLLQGADSEAGRDYRRVNPQGLVPALRVGVHVIAQSTAIVEYLEEVHPNPPLLPKSPEDRALVRSMCQIVACDIHPLNNLRVLNYLKGPLEQEQAEVDVWYNHWVASGFHAFQALVEQQGGQYCFGDEVTLADVYLVPQMFNAHRFNCDVKPFGKLQAICERLAALPAFKNAAPEAQEGAS